MAGETGWEKPHEVQGPAAEEEQPQAQNRCWGTLLCPVTKHWSRVPSEAVEFPSLQTFQKLCGQPGQKTC